MTGSMAGSFTVHLESAGKCSHEKVQGLQMPKKSVSPFREIFVVGQIMKPISIRQNMTIMTIITNFILGWWPLVGWGQLFYSGWSWALGDPMWRWVTEWSYDDMTGPNGRHPAANTNRPKVCCKQMQHQIWQNLTLCHEKNRWKHWCKPFNQKITVQKLCEK